MNDEDFTNYYAVIPSPVRYSFAISNNAKLLYGEMEANSYIDNTCHQPTSYFSKVFQVTPATIRKWLKELKTAGFISIEKRIIHMHYE